MAANGSVDKALAEAKALVAALESHDGTPAIHLALLKRTDNIRWALEEPSDIITRWLDNTGALSAAYILTRIGAFKEISTDGTGVPASAIAKNCNVDVSVVTRTIRLLITQGIFTETGVNEYTHNSLSLAFASDFLRGFISMLGDMVKTWSAFPEYVKAHKPDDIYDLKKSPFAFAAGHEGKTYYEVIDLDPEERHLWNIVLSMLEKSYPILGMFPFKEMEQEVTSHPDRPFIVDVGGGRGQVLHAVQKECGGSFGAELILQDLPVVIDSLKPEETTGIRPMAYDIFTPQPIKNAHIYFMRRLLHDFYNPVVVEILKNTIPAMGPSSRLIVCDMIIPERTQAGVDTALYTMDFSLLTVSGQERTLDEFKAIFDEVGLELIKVYPSGIGQTAMLETRLKSR